MPHRSAAALRSPGKQGLLARARRDAIMSKAAKAHDDLFLPAHTSIRGHIVKQERVDDYWTPTMTAELLIYAYGIIASTMTKRPYFCCPLLDGCFGCNKYPHRLPPAKKIVEMAFNEFTDKYTNDRMDGIKTVEDEIRPPADYAV